MKILHMQTLLKKYKLALLGENISLSGSPAIYKNLLKDSLDRYDLLSFNNKSSIPSVNELLTTYDGLNVTAPFKKIIYEQCNVTSDIAKQCQGVNCIKREGSEIIGELTDYSAARYILQGLLPQSSGLPIIILGDGVMSNMLAIIFLELNINCTICSRNKGWGDAFSRPALLINTCLKQAKFPGRPQDNSIVWDFNYNYESMLQKNQQVKYLDGKSLLIKQAQDAIQFWAN